MCCHCIKLVSPIQMAYVTNSIKVSVLKAFSFVTPWYTTFFSWLGWEKKDDWMAVTSSNLYVHIYLGFFGYQVYF